MSVFAPMDSWIAAGGRSDDWLSLGLDLLDGWQAVDGGGQAHLVDVLTALHTVRPAVPASPDPLVIAVWFHHAAVPESASLSGPAVLELSATLAYERIAALGEPALAREVSRLVRQIGARHPDPEDLAGGLVHAAHRAAVSSTHLAAVPPVPHDQ